ncbi:MAG: 50S ribosomal protein L35 [Acidobacteriota bacterium]|nr:MAG: 50S ribosomal protein L35 [Acidobacteriota bacterium]
MPKQKTNRSVKKRFRVTSKGKVVHSKMSRRHYLGLKKSARRRRLRKAGVLVPKMAKRVKRLLPYA